MRRTVGLLLLLALSACGTTSGAIEIPPEDLPFPVTRGASAAESPAVPRTFAVAFVRDGRLVEVRREVRADVPGAEAALRALLEGPNPGEEALRISTELSDQVRLLQVFTAGPTAHVDLSAEFQEPAPPDRIALRVAQVVWTLTALDDVRSVAFSIDGEPIDVTAADGTALVQPVSRSDYASLAPAR